MTRNKGFVWNMVGSLCSAMMTVLLTVATTRIVGPEEGGVVSLAIGISHIFSMLSTYQVRNYQATDVEKKNSFGDYFMLRVITSLIMTIALMIYIALSYGTDTAEKKAAIFLFSIHQILMGMSDVYQGLFQQNDRIDMAGKSVAFQVVLSVSAFILALIICKNIVISAAIMPLIVVGWIAVYDRPKSKFLRLQEKQRMSREHLKSIVISCFPLLVSAFVTMYELNISKIYIDRVNADLQIYWTALFLPASIVNMFSLFIFRPALSTLSIDWKNNCIFSFSKSTLHISLLILGFSVFALAAAWVFGIFFLELLYGLSLAPYRSVLMIVMIGGTFCALSTFFNCILTVVRYQHRMFLIDCGIFMVAIILIPWMIQRNVLWGAAVSYSVIMLLRAVGFLWLYLCILSRRKKEVSHG